MNSILTAIKQRNNNWFIGWDNNQFNEMNQEILNQFYKLNRVGTVPKIILAESNPCRFLAAFIAAVAADCSVFLGNPNWTPQEWQYVLALVQPDLIWGDLSIVIPQESFVKNNGQWIMEKEATMGVTELGVCRQRFSVDGTKVPTTNPKIMIPTGGSSGKIHFAMHTWDTLMASVRGFYQYFDQKPVNSFCVLPVYHVSGLMQFLRSLTTGGRFASLPFKDVVAGKGRDIDPRDFFISLVPTQLQRLLRVNAASWLSQFPTVLLGGAPAWESLLTEARQQDIRLAPTYGMTETASQVVTLKPDAFLAGNNSCGQVLPHAKVTIRSTTGEVLGTNQIGIVTIEAESLALGYYSSGDQGKFPHYQSPIEEEKALCMNATPDKISTLQSDDLGFFDDQGHLNIVGRHSHKIISGGENIFPIEVEAAILATELVSDVCVIGIPDEYWGQAVTAVYVPRLSEVSVDVLKAALVDRLNRFKQPKYWVYIEKLPRNEQGKVNYEFVEKIALAKFTQ
ncbi:MAG: 2-succinylbenzoate--CoA ligase [Coleofasciculus sp. G3-WIS-01]|uniref:2-succinylbenzoate--CoA ligase n=1 Tax=Coleofasciculus sp. G3-WIS-01 TaxID=3069528 RepID=UPI003304D31C